MNFAPPRIVSLGRLCEILKYATYKTDCGLLGRGCFKRPETRPVYFLVPERSARFPKRTHFHGTIGIPAAIDAEAYVRRLVYNLEDALAEFEPPNGSRSLDRALARDLTPRPCNGEFQPDRIRRTVLVEPILDLEKWMAYVTKAGADALVLPPRKA